MIGITRAYCDMLRTGVRERPGMKVAWLIQQRLGIPMGAWMEERRERTENEQPRE